MTATIVVGVEGTPSSADALWWAAQAAKERRSTLELLHATGFPTIALDVLYDDVIQEGALTLLEKEAARVHERFSDLQTRLRVDRGTAAHALCERSRDVDLVVIGSHPLSGFERVVTGSLSYQIAAGAYCPVVIVPALPPDDAAGVVVGADGSPDSLEAIELAAKEAERIGEDLHVVHAWQEPAMYLQADFYPVDFADELRDAERLILAESVAGLAERYPDLVVHRVLVQDQPSQALIDAAAKAKLLVVGSRGRHGVARALLGSVSHSVVLHAPCPVMVARTWTHRTAEHT